MAMAVSSLAMAAVHCSSARAPSSPRGPIRKKPMENIYGIRVERAAPKQRLEQLGVAKWSTWASGDCWYAWDWKVDEWVYIEKGGLSVYPKWSDMSGHYEAGDLVRFPKWFEAALVFEGDYLQRYKFVAYGDTELD